MGILEVLLTILVGLLWTGISLLWLAIVIAGGIWILLKMIIAIKNLLKKG